MEKNTNIAELLKNAPSGKIELYLTTEGFCTFDCVFDDVGRRNYIRVHTNRIYKKVELNPFGQSSADGHCLLYPNNDKSRMTWDNWQELLMPCCVGSVIIDRFNEPFLITEFYLYPVNPNEPFSIIRFHKFDYTGARFATPEESKKFFKDLYDNGYCFNEKTKSVETITDEEKESDKISKANARQYLPTTSTKHNLTAGDEADFVFSNEECKQSAMNMAKYKDEEFKKFLCYYFKFGEKLFEMYKNGDYKIEEIQ